MEHEKTHIFHQGESMCFLWTEVRFIVNLPEGLTLRIYLTSEKEQYIEIII
jgi:hypothetical protein